MRKDILEAPPAIVALIGIAVIGMVIAMSGCGQSASITTPVVVSSPSPLPIEYRVQAVATQGGANGFTGDVNAGEDFKTSITGVTCVQGGVVVSCPIFGGYLWRQTNAPTGTCSDAGSVDSSVDLWQCGDPTVPGAAEFQGCVLDFDRTILGCASVKVRVH
jgi:hypothetical protein